MPRFTVIPAVYLVLRRTDEVLLLRRANTGYRDGEYSLPAGHHDGGESLLSAMVREAKEEIGIDVHEDDLRLAHVMHRNAADGERVDFYFTCDKWLGDVTNCEEHKCDELRWTSLTVHCRQTRFPRYATYCTPSKLAHRSPHRAGTRC